MTAQLQPIRKTAGIRDTAGQDRALDIRPAQRRRAWIAGILMAAAVLTTVVVWPAASRFVSAERSVARERLRFATVARSDFVRDVAVRGRVVAAVKPTLFAPADGSVTLEAQAGDTVRAGQVLARVDSPELNSRLDQERSTLERLATEITRQEIEKRKQELRNRQTVDLARVAIVAAERELKRAEVSWADRLISRQDFEAARDDLARARLEVAHAVENERLESESLAFDLQTRALERDRQRYVVQELERQVADLVVRSPVDGMVGDLLVDQKAAVNRNQPLMTVVDLTAYEVEIQAPQEYGDDLGPGTAAEIRFGQTNYAGELSSVSPEIKENQVTGRVRFAGDRPPGLRQNQRVSARLILDSRKDALVVQRGPFLDSGGGQVAYVVKGEVAHRRAIRIGAASIGAVEVLEGLDAGDTVVISDLAPFEGAETVLLTH